ncbi:HAD-IA family hydrolase [Pectobacteriaceae bacterium CE70]|nr:HAD-IA family hydrolase [Pectobacteriaceae bacterium CE70]WJY10649.1 HAD-IA family hydrolase [Pectobacteriaceae bacterium C80]
MGNVFSGFLFDMDGTLVDSTAVVEQTWKTFSLEHALNYGDVIAFAHGRRTEETVTHFLGASRLSQKITHEIEYRETIMTAGITAVPGAVDVLQSIQPAHWAVVTSASRQLAINRLLATGLPLPPLLISAEDVKIGKPDPQGYLPGAMRMKLDIKDVLVFEDAQAGMKAAIASGASLAIIGDVNCKSERVWGTLPDFRQFRVELCGERYQVDILNH